MSATTLNTARPEWFPGQVTVDSRSDFRVVMEGKATNGGFAIDQLVFSRGKCESMYRKLLLLIFYAVKKLFLLSFFNDET